MEQILDYYLEWHQVANKGTIVVRFRENPRVQLPWVTRLCATLSQHSELTNKVNYQHTYT